MKEFFKQIFSKQFWADFFTGLDRFVESVSLLTVSIFTAYGALHYVTVVLQQRFLMAAAGVIGMRGSWEFIKFVSSRKAN
jgi:hypothetical protein